MEVFFFPAGTPIKKFFNKTDRCLREEKKKVSCALPWRWKKGDFPGVRRGAEGYVKKKISFVLGVSVDYSEYISPSCGFRTPSPLCRTP